MLFLLLLFFPQNVLSLQTITYNVLTSSVESPLYFNYKHEESHATAQLRPSIDQLLSDEIKESGYKIICYNNYEQYITVNDGRIYHKPYDKKRLDLYEPPKNDDTISVIKDFWTKKESDIPNVTFNGALAWTWHYNKFLHWHLLKDKRFSKKMFILVLSRKEKFYFNKKEIGQSDIESFSELDINTVIRSWLRNVQIEQDLIKESEKNNANSDTEVEELYKTLFLDSPIIFNDLSRKSIASKKSFLYQIMSNEYLQGIISLTLLFLAIIQIKTSLSNKE